MTWPRKIFIESTALFQLGPRLENVDFANLLNLREAVQFELFISNVNFREYLRFRKKELQQTRNRLQEASRDLDKYSQNYPEFGPVLKQLDRFSSTIEKHFEEKFKALGIKVLPLPKIEIETLVRMSIDGTPPFEEKASEKGFRDAVTMFSILEEIEDRTEDHALVITGDALLTEGLLTHAAAYATAVYCVDGFPAAHKHMEKQLTASYRDYLRHESEEAKAVLLGYESTLEAKIAEIREIEQTDFGGLFGIIKDENGTSLSVDRVHSVRFAGIEAAVWKDRDRSHSKILFRVKCEANVVVRNPYFPLFGVPRYPIGGPVVYSKSTQSQETFERTVPLWFYGQATLAKKDSTWVLEDLRIDRRMPDQEDFFDLMRAAAPKEST